MWCTSCGIGCMPSPCLFTWRPCRLDMPQAVRNLQADISDKIAAMDLEGDQPGKGDYTVSKMPGVSLIRPPRVVSCRSQCTTQHSSSQVCECARARLCTGQRDWPWQQ